MPTKNMFIPRWGGGIFVTASLFAVSFRQPHFCDLQRAKQKSFRREGQAREVSPREALPTEAGGRAALRNSCRRRSPFCIAALEARKQFESQMRDSPLGLGEVEGGQCHGVRVEEGEEALSPHSLRSLSRRAGLGDEGPEGDPLEPDKEDQARHSPSPPPAGRATNASAAG